MHEQWCVSKPDTGRGGTECTKVLPHPNSARSGSRCTKRPLHWRTVQPCSLGAVFTRAHCVYVCTSIYTGTNEYMQMSGKAGKQNDRIARVWAFVCSPLQVADWPAVDWNFPASHNSQPPQSPAQSFFVRAPDRHASPSSSRVCASSQSQSGRFSEATTSSLHSRAHSSQP